MKNYITHILGQKNKEIAQYSYPRLNLIYFLSSEHKFLSSGVTSFVYITVSLFTNGTAILLHKLWD